MAAVALVQVPAVLWYAIVATPACDEARSTAAVLAAQVGLVAVAVAAAGVAVTLGVRFMRLRHGWWLWWPMPLLALVGPALMFWVLPQLSPGTGGLLCT